MLTRAILLAFASVVPLVDLASAQPPAVAAKKYAPLVGVNEYDNRKLANLSDAERDATGLAKVPCANGFELTTSGIDGGKAVGLAAGTVEKFEVAPGVFMEFCWIPAGEAQLGSPKAERDYLTKTFHDGNRPDWLDGENESTRGVFKSKQGFWLGKYEVTQGEWVKGMGANPSAFDGKKDNKAKDKDTSRFPVENVSWDDIQPFVKKVNGRPGAGKAFGKAGTFVLPHEDEWEYACRGGKGNKQAFHFGDVVDGTKANCDGKNYPYGTTKNDGEYLARTCAVDDASLKYPPHPWGLCHMHGNVWELCENNNKQSEARGAARGGSWNDFARSCRAANRFRNAPGLRYSNSGFRLCFRLD